MPELVILMAKEHLMRLTTESVEKSSKRNVFSAATCDFIEEQTIKEHPALALLYEIIPDEISPKEALEKLYMLKKEAEKG